MSKKKQATEPVGRSQLATSAYVHDTLIGQLSIFSSGILHVAELDMCQSDINSEKGRLSNVNQQAYGEQTDGVQNITNTYRHTQVIGYYDSGGGVHVLRVCVVQYVIIFV